MKRTAWLDALKCGCLPPLVCAALFCTTSPVLSKATYVTFDVPGAIETYAYVANHKTTIAGQWVDASQMEHGYVRAPNGKIISFDPTGSVNTYVSGLNDGGEIAGYFLDADNTEHGFLRAPDGTITVYDAPGSSADSTQIEAINSKGVFTGDFCTDTGCPAFIQYSKDKFKSFSIEGASLVIPYAINDAGATTGYYLDADGNPHGFQRTSDGTVLTFDPPQSIETLPFAINSQNVIVGRYYTADGLVHSFLRMADGRIKNIDNPNVPVTAARSINDKNEIIGRFSDDNGQTHGFILPAKGRFTPIDPKHSAATFAVGINNDGLIVGDFADENGVYHGYLRTPSGKAETDQSTVLARDIPPPAMPDTVARCNSEGLVPYRMPAGFRNGCP